MHCPCSITDQNISLRQRKSEIFGSFFANSLGSGFNSRQGRLIFVISPLRFGYWFLALNMQETIIDIKNLSGAYEGELKRLNKALISEHNKKLILEFNRFYILEGISLSRRIRILSILSSVAIKINKDFDKATKEDLMDYVEYLESSDYKEWTRYTFKQILKRFYKWLKGNNTEYPLEIKWMKSSKGRFKHKIPEELISKEEAIKLIDKAETIRDKALISTLFESGCRISELGNLRIKNVVFDQYGTVIIVSGKTGMRRIRLIDSTPYLANWIENHPFRDDSEKPLWCSTFNRKNAIGYQTINKLLRKAAERTGLKKKVNPHIFRHSRSTINANFLTESQMNNYFGWTQGSRMPSIYVHLSGRDIDATIINMHSSGQKVIIDKASENNFDPKSCPRCRNSNPSTSKFCNRCGAILELKNGFENG